MTSILPTTVPSKAFDEEIRKKIVRFLLDCLMPQIELKHLSRVLILQAIISACVNTFIMNFIIPMKFKDMPWTAIIASLSSGLMTGLSTVCLWNKIESIGNKLDTMQKDIATMQKDMATKDDLKFFATKADLTNLENNISNIISNALNNHLNTPLVTTGIDVRRPFVASP